MAEDIATLGFQVNSNDLATAETRLRAIDAAAKRTGISVEEMNKRVKAASASTVASLPSAAGIKAWSTPTINEIEKVTATGLSQRQMWRLLTREIALLSPELANLTRTMGLLSVGGTRLGLGMTALAITFAAVGAAVTKTVGAYIDFEQHQKQITAALAVTGGASGQTAASLEKSARAIAETGIASLTSIREAQTELLKFKAVSGDAFGPALEVALKLSQTGFEDLKSAAKATAQAIADPANANDALVASTIKLNAAQRDEIDRALKAGDVAKAYKLVLEDLQKATENISVKADDLAGAWGRLKNVTGDTFVEFGRWISEGGKLKETLDGITEATKKAIEANQKTTSGSKPGVLKLNVGSAGPIGPVLSPEDAAVVENQLKIKKATEDVTKALKDQGETAGKSAVEIEVYNQTVLKGIPANTAAAAAIRDQVTANMSATQFRGTIDGLKQQAAAADIAAKATTMGAGAAAAYTAAETAKSNAIIAGLPLTDKQIAQVKEQAAAIGAATQAQAKSQVAWQLKLETQQANNQLTEEEVAILQRLKPLYGEDIPNALAQAEAAQIKLNNRIMEGKSNVESFANSFVQGLIQSQGAAKAAQSAMQSLASTLASQAIKQALQGGSLAKAGTTAAGGALAAVAAGTTSPITGALAGAASGALLGSAVLPGIGTVAGAVIGGVAGFLSGSSNRSAAAATAAQAAAQAAADALALEKEIAGRRSDLNLQANLSGINTSTLAGALQAFELTANDQRAKEAASGGNEISELERALAASRLKIIDEFAERVRQREQSNQDRLFNATNDQTTLAGRLAAFDRFAERERLEEVKAGGEAIVSLEEAQAAERLQIQKQYTDAIIARDKALNSRLLAAITDSSTLEGQLAIFDQQAQVQREEEARLGGEDMVKLEVTLMAERLRIIQDFSKQSIAAEKQRSDQILSFVNNLLIGASSPLSPSARLSQAQTTFNQQLALAQANDPTALARITQDANNLIEAAKSFFGSASGFQTIFAQVASALLTLASPTDPVVAALQQTITAIGGTTSAVNNTTSAVGGTTSAVGNTTSAVNSSTGVLNIINASTAATNAQVTTANALQTTANSLMNTANSLLDAIRALNDTSKQQLELLTTRMAQIPASTSGPFGSISSNNQLLEALNKIVLNTYLICGNTGVTAFNTAANSTHGALGTGGVQVVGALAAGGWINGGIQGVDSVPIMAMPGEFVVRRSVAQANAGLLTAMNSGGGDVAQLLRIIADKIDYNTQATIGQTAQINRETKFAARKNRSAA